MPINRGIAPTRFPEQRELRERFIQAARDIMGLDKSSEPVAEKQQVSADLNENEGDGDKKMSFFGRHASIANSIGRPISETSKREIQGSGYNNQWLSAGVGAFKNGNKI